MALLYTVDAPDTTGRNKNAQMMGPNVMRYTGTWDANGEVTGTIDLTDTTVTNVGMAAKDVLAYGVHVAVGTIASIVATAPNLTGGGGAGPGKIGIITCAVDNTGTWWADVVI
jgi:hypothetical protein